MHVWVVTLLDTVDSKYTMLRFENWPDSKGLRGWVL